MSGARTVSRGTCSLCGEELVKGAVARHLKACVPEHAVQKGKKTRAFHLLVEGRREPMYWMHLAVPADATLEVLDGFLRETWLECCGHLSAFEIDHMRYLSGPGDLGDESMDVALGEVLSPGTTFRYEYDFGSTTELKLKVLSEHESACERDTVRELARNEPPRVACSHCDRPAVRLCTECAWSGGGPLCEACAADHECGEDMLLPLVNSPRAGVCGYAG